MTKKTSYLLTATLAFAIIILLTSAINKSQTNVSKYLTMRVLEYGGQTTTRDNKIIVVNEDGNIEETPLETSSQKGVVANTKKINEKINALSALGYQLVSTSGTDQWTSTYTFIKK